MTIKVTAITVSVCAILLFIFATIFPNDPYFYALVSSTLAVTICRLMLSLLLVYLAFKKKFKSVYGPSLLAGLAVLLASFGVVGLFIPQITYGLFNWFKPMDFIFAIEAAITLGLIVVSFERGENRLTRPHFSRPRSRTLMPSLDLSMFGLISHAKNQEKNLTARG